MPDRGAGQFSDGLGRTAPSDFGFPNRLSVSRTTALRSGGRPFTRADMAQEFLRTMCMTTLPASRQRSMTFSISS